MIDNFLLFLLVPYALLLVLALRKLSSRVVPVILLACLTIFVVWFTLYAVYCLRPFSHEIGPEEAFASVDEIMRSIETYSTICYFVPRLGWLASTAFFVACWAVAQLFPRRSSA
jgi:hypothetical protein